MKTYFSLVLFLLGSSFAFAATNPADPDSASASVTAPVNPLNGHHSLPLGLLGREEMKAAQESHYKRWSKLKYSGYIRSYNQYRHISSIGAGYPVASKNLFTVNGLDIIANGATVSGYQEPFFLLRLEGSPTSKTHFKLETAFDNQLAGILRENTDLLGSSPSGAANRRALVYRIFQFTGKANTKIGNFRLVSGGGVIWWRLSPFTYWNYQWRDRMFERYPWEPEGNPWSRYNTYYGNEEIPRDQRWGNTGTQGFVLEGTGLPLGFGFTAIYGKTDNSGGFQTYLSKTPKNVLAGRIEKLLGKNKVGINYFNQFGYTDGNAHRLYYDRDSLERGVSTTFDPLATPDTLLTTMFKTRQQILTVDARLLFPGIKVFAEVGAGRFQDSLIHTFSGHNDSLNAVLENQIGLPKSGNYYVNGLNYNWGHAINFQVEFDRSLTRIPFSLQFYSISPNTVNINSAVMNTANPHALSDLKNVGTPSDVTTFYGGITELQNGQMANNRWEFRLRHEDTYGKLKVTAALSMGRELKNLYNTVTFQHQINDFPRSRFGYFARNIGPYSRVINLYRRTYEGLMITDTTVNYKKAYNGFFAVLKYKFLLFNKELILSNYTDYNSVQDALSPIPLFSDKAFVRTFTDEFLTFYAIHPKVTLITLLGLERNFGNMRTELVDAGTGNVIKDAANNPIYKEGGLPMNQVGYSYGLGLDVNLTDRAGLYLRHRWFYFQDLNQFKDHFNGSESTVELKIFF